MKKLIIIFLAFLSMSAYGQVESYKTYIYTSETLSDEIKTAYDETQSRGLGMNMLNAGLNALKGIGGGVITSVLDFGVNLIGQAISDKMQEHKKWEDLVKAESEYETTVSTLAELNNFYDKISLDGPMDPQGMLFDGIGCLNVIDKDTVFFMSCHINRDMISRIVEHSKFELVLDTLIVNPYKSHLPNTSLDIPFNFAERQNFSLGLFFDISSSWMDQLPQLNKDQLLGSFSINVPISEKELDTDGVFRYVRDYSEKPKYDIIGESFIVPRSYMSVRDENNVMRHTWGTGEYKISMRVKERCGVSEVYRDSWKDDLKNREKLQPKKNFWKSAWKLIASQKWDELSKSWIVTTIKAPTEVLSKEIINDLHLNSNTSANKSK